MRTAPRRPLPRPLLTAILSFAFTHLVQAASPPIAQSEIVTLEKECMAVDSAEQCKKALPGCAQVEAARQKDPPSRDRDLALAKLWQQFVECEYRLGQYDVAEQYGRRALTLRQKLLGLEHPDVTESLNSLAMVLHKQTKFSEAETLHRQALVFRQKLLGSEHADVAESLNNLATVLTDQGKYDEAKRLHHQSLAMRQKMLGPENVEVATSLTNLAGVLYQEGRYGEAEPLYRQALAMQQLFGPESHYVPLSLHGLALVLYSQGKYEEAETLVRQAIGIQQNLLGAQHPDVAQSLLTLAHVFYRQGKYGEMETPIRQALAMQQKLLGSQHPDVAMSLNDLAAMFFSQGKYREAETLHRQALAMRQKLLGSEHPEVAHSLNNLADVLEVQGKYGEAETLHSQALALCQKLLAPEHPDVAHSLNKLGRFLLAQGRLAAALDALRKGAHVNDEQLRATVSETRMQARLQSLRDEEDAIYSLLLSKRPLSAVPKLALSLALLRKGRVAEAGALANRLLHRKLVDPEVQKRFDEWQSVRQQHEALLYRGLGNPKPADYHAHLKDLQIQAESLEAQLAQTLPEIRSLQPPPFVEIVRAVAQRLPQSGALVEIVWARHYGLPTKDKGSRWGAPHFVALLLQGDQRIESVDLGEATVVDALGRSLLAALRDPSADPKAASQALYRTVFAPLLPHLQGKKDLFLSLDGTLHMIPFDALHDGIDYLLGRYRFHYLTSGRDLLRQPSQRPVGPALILANPDFGQVDREPAIDPQSFYQRLPGFASLAAAQREAEQLSKLLGVTPLLATAARESALRGSLPPRILHIATHGLFLTDADESLLPRVRSSLLALSPWDHPPPPTIGTTQTMRLPGTFGPMNRSALLLAGVRQGHRAPDTTQDGLLTAEEARSLDLDGTQLVVLSACETGQGELSVGQGVYGLRRAFLVAGAETVVTSLWRVHDEATGELMTAYYRKLLDTKKPGDRLGSMIEAMQELRSRPGRSHPYYWAPFLVIGQDGPLRTP